MSEFSNERVSEWMDSENPDDAVIDRLLDDKAVRDKWERYQIIGTALRGEAPIVNRNNDICAKVAAVLQDEPTILAPKPSRVGRQSRINVVNLLKYIGQYGIAASVAVGVLVGVQQYGSNSQTEMSPLPVLNTTPFVGAAHPVSLNAPTADMQASSQRQAAEQRRRISAYLQDHHEQLRVQPFAKAENAAKLEVEAEQH